MSLGMETASYCGGIRAMSKPKTRKALGIDFGGTIVKLGLVNDQGRIERRASFPTAETKGPQSWIERVAAVFGELGLPANAECLSDRIAGIGIGVPGFTDFERGFIYELTNVPDWVNVPLAEMMEQRFGTPTFVDNDVNAMTIGECAFGGGQAYRHAVFVTLGTGVGGGLLINGALYRGAYSMAGEIGHMSIDMNGPRSRQGVGGLELYVGNRAMAARAAEAIRAGRPTRLREAAGGDPDRLTPRDIAEAAAAGDALALEIYDFVARCLATAFASIVYLLQPQAFIVGGGVAQAGAVLFDPLGRHLRDRLAPVFAERIEVRPATLGNDAGIIGCAKLVLG